MNRRDVIGLLATLFGVVVADAEEHPRTGNLTIGDVWSQWKGLVNREGGRVQELSLHRSTTIALNAFWLNMLSRSYDRELRRFRVNAASNVQFLGFVEGRMRIRPPAWWADIISRRYGEGNALLEGASVTAHGNATEFVVTEQDATLFVASNAVSTRLDAPKAMMIDWFGGHTIATVVDEKCVYVCRFPALPLRYQIACFDCNSGELLWDSVVWVGETDPSGFGHRHDVQMVLSEGRVIVLGGGTECYLQAFNVRDGATVAWWTTRLDRDFRQELEAGARKPKYKRPQQ